MVEFSLCDRLIDSLTSKTNRKEKEKKRGSKSFEASFLLPLGVRHGLPSLSWSELKITLILVHCHFIDFGLPVEGTPNEVQSYAHHVSVCI